MSTESSLRILLIEDNPGDALLLQELLSEVPEPRFVIQHVESVDEARTAVEERQPDAILLDLNLPDSRGLETIDRVRNLPSKAPIIVVSGGIGDSIREAAIERGAGDVLDKEEPTGRLFARALLYSLSRHHAAQKSRQIEEILAATPDAVLVVNEQGIVRYVNPSAVRLLGRSREDFVGELLGFSVAKGRSTLLEVLGTDTSGVGEMRVADLDWEGEPAHVVSIRDVTDEHRLRTRLDTAEARLRHVLTSSDAVLWTATVGDEAVRSDRFAFEFVTEGLTRVLGYPVAEALEPGWWLDTVHPEDEALVHEALAAIHAGESRNVEHRMRHGDGSYRWMNTNLHVVRLPEEGAEVVAMLVDVTHRKNLERQIQLAQRIEAVGLLAGGVAHDFNNVLTAIYSCAETAARHLPADHEAAAEVVEIQRAAERAASLTRQLLAFGRQQVLEPRVVDMNDAVTGTGKLLRRLIGAHVKLTLSLTPEPAPVFVDPGQLEQIILNLAVNARDAMPQGGTLMIESTGVRLSGDYAEQRPSVPPGEYVVLSVSDTGTGMDEDTQSRIFEPYFSTKEIGSGTGLGLATVYGIVKQSGGHIWVYSEIGRGTTIRVYFPRSGGELVEESASDLGPVRGGEERILFVEDDDGVRRAGAEILGSLGYDLIVASNGGEALSMLDRASGDPPALVVTDVVMPVMGGQRLAMEVRKCRPGTPILFVSGYSRDAVMQHGHLVTESSFLQKPYTPSTLGRRVRELLDKAGNQGP